MNKKHWICSLLLLVFGLGNITDVQGQGRWRGFWQVRSAEYDDTNLLYIGIVPQYSFSRYFIEKSPAWNTLSVTLPDGTSDQFAAITNPGGHEIGVGIPVRLRINHHWSVGSGIIWMFERGRYQGTASGTGSGPGLEYHTENYASNISRMQSGNNTSGENFPIIEIPLHLKLHSDYKNFSSNSPHPYRLYLVGGTKYNRSFNANTYYSESDNFERTDPSLIFRSGHWMMEGGLGLDLYFTYFKMSLETRYSQSIGNLLNTDHPHANIAAWPNPYMGALNKVGIRGWQFSIILE